MPINRNPKKTVSVILVIPTTVCIWLGEAVIELDSWKSITGWVAKKATKVGPSFDAYRSIVLYGLSLSAHEYVAYLHEVLVIFFFLLCFEYPMH